MRESWGTEGGLCESQMCPPQIFWVLPYTSWLPLQQSRARWLVLASGLWAEGVHIFRPRQFRVGKPLLSPFLRELRGMCSTESVTRWEEPEPLSPGWRRVCHPHLLCFCCPNIAAFEQSPKEDEGVSHVVNLRGRGFQAEGTWEWHLDQLEYLTDNQFHFSPAASGGLACTPGSFFKKEKRPIYFAIASEEMWYGYLPLSLFLSFPGLRLFSFQDRCCLLWM